MQLFAIFFFGLLCTVAIALVFDFGLCIVQNVKSLSGVLYGGLPRRAWFALCFLPGFYLSLCCARASVGGGSEC